MAEDDIPAGSDHRLDRDGPGAALAPRKDAISRIGADRVAAEATAIATVAGGMVLGAFYPAEAKAAAVGGSVEPAAVPGGEEADRMFGTHGDAVNDQTVVAPQPAPASLHDVAALIQAEGDAALAHLEAAFEAATAAIVAPTIPAGVADPSPQATGAVGSSSLPPLVPPSDGHAFHPVSAGGVTDGPHTIQHGLSDTVLGDRALTSGLIGTGAALIPSVAGVADTVAHTLDAAASALPSGLDNLLGAVEGPVATLSQGLTAPFHAVTDAAGDILEPAANLTQVAGDIAAPVLGKVAAPVLGEVAEIASGPVAATASLVSEVPAVATSLVGGNVEAVADHAATAVPSVVEGAIQTMSAPLDLPSLNLGFLGQSYSDLGHGEVGPHHDQGLLHGLV